MQFTFEPEKALEALLYAAKHTPDHDLYKTLKVLYVADKLHLSRYGRFIYGETYARLPLGPVPQSAYDVVRSVTEPWRRTKFGREKVLEALDRKGTTLIPKREPDVLELSKSDVECLDEAIAELRDLGINRIKEKTHDSAWEATASGRNIPVELIVEALPDDRQQAVRDYLSSF